MSVIINYKTNLAKKNLSNLIFFTDEKFNINSLKKHISSTEYSFIFDLIKSKDPNKKIISFDINSKRKIILVSIKKNIKSSEFVNLGAKFYDLFKDLKQHDYNLNSDSLNNNSRNFIGYFLHGLKLKSYKFEKYKTKKNKINIKIFVTGKNKPSLQEQIKFKAL